MVTRDFIKYVKNKFFGVEGKIIKKIFLITFLLSYAGARASIGRGLFNLYLLCEVAAMVCYIGIYINGKCKSKGFWILFGPTDKLFEQKPIQNSIWKMGGTMLGGVVLIYLNRKFGFDITILGIHLIDWVVEKLLYELAIFIPLVIYVVATSVVSFIIVVLFCLVKYIYNCTKKAKVAH